METRVAVLAVIVQEGSSVQALNERCCTNTGRTSSDGWEFPTGSAA